MKPLAEVANAMESMKHLEYLYHAAIAMEKDRDESQVEMASDSDR